MQVNDVSHHLTLEFIEIEQISTKHLDTTKKNLDEVLESLNIDDILLTSAKNKDLLSHFNRVVALTVGRKLAVRVKGGQFLKKLFPNHYDHPNAYKSMKPAKTHVKKPLYLHEMKNDEMIEISRNLQHSRKSD